MSTENRAKYWLDVAEEDMSLAEYIFKGGIGYILPLCAIRQ